MTPEEVFLAWAPADSIWSPWAIPVPFAEITCVNFNSASELELTWTPVEGLVPAGDLAVVLDLPGETCVHVALALATKGFRPVPLIDGSPNSTTAQATPVSLRLEAGRSNSGPNVAVDMRQLLRWLCIGAAELPATQIPLNAPPAFMLDSLRVGTAREAASQIFDNRWKTFPQDFPSARFLREQGISRVLLLQDGVYEPSEDLAHVLLRWQEEGIAIHSASATSALASQPIKVRRPNLFRALWYRALALIGLKRRAGGGFGAWPHGSGGS